MTKRMIVPKRPLRMVPQSSTLLLEASLDAFITSMSEPATSTQLDFEWHSLQIDCHVQKDSSDLSQRKLFLLISFHSDGKSNTKKPHFAVCADGQSDESRRYIALARR